MSDYKEEVFLIKGRYYTFTQNYLAIPLTRYGAIEGGITIDDSDRIGKYDDYCADVLIKKHDGKWGVFPSVSINGMGCADWASENDNPFIYEDYLIASSGEFGEDPNTYETFLLLKNGALWEAHRVVEGTESPISLPIEDGLSFEDEKVLVDKLEQKYGISLHVQERYNIPNEEDECTVFDDNKEFVRRYTLSGDNKRFIKMLFGMEPYMPDMSYLYAAAHKNVYATILIGKNILDDFLKQDKEGKQEKLNDYEKALLDCCMDYLSLGKQYAEIAHNTTMSDIADVLLDEAQDIRIFRSPSKFVSSEEFQKRILKLKKKKD